MKNLIKLLLIVIVVFILNVNVKALELDINSKNAILYNTNDNKVLYQKNKNEKVQIASLTKIMTAIITIENVKNLDDKVTLIDNDFKGLIEEGLVTAGFTPNETVSYRDLLYGLLLPSGADAAKALARLVGKNEANFVSMMNEKAKELKLTQTNFTNPIGLDDENNYSTAKEVSIIFSYAIKNEEFKTIITKNNYKTSDNKITFKNKIKNNKNVGNYLLGGKAGTTSGAGLCLASIAGQDNVNLLLVTLNAPYDKKGPHNYEDAKTIYSYFLDNYSYKYVLNKKEKVLTLKTKYAKNDQVDFYPQKSIKVYLPNNINKNNLSYKYKGINYIDPSMKQGTKLGTLKVYYQNEKIAETKIILKEKQQFSIIKFIKENKIIILLAVIIFILIVIINLIKKVKK